MILFALYSPEFDATFYSLLALQISSFHYIWRDGAHWYRLRMFIWPFICMRKIRRRFPFDVTVLRHAISHFSSYALTIRLHSPPIFAIFIVYTHKRFCRTYRVRHWYFVIQPGQLRASRLCRCHLLAAFISLWSFLSDIWWRHDAAYFQLIWRRIDDFRCHYGKV